MTAAPLAFPAIVKNGVRLGLSSGRSPSAPGAPFGHSRISLAAVGGGVTACGRLMRAAISRMIFIAVLLRLASAALLRAANPPADNPALPIAQSILSISYRAHASAAADCRAKASAPARQALC